LVKNLLFMLSISRTPSSRKIIFAEYTSLSFVRTDLKQRMQSRWLNQPTLTLKIPSLIDEVVKDQEDKGCTHERK
jgi:hypothetical protein